MSYLLNPTEAIADAKAEGFKVYRGSSTTLLLDLDTPQQRNQFKRMFEWLQEEESPLRVLHIKIEKKAEWVSKSGVGRHVILEINRKLSLSQRLLLQATLSSDPKREVLSLLRNLIDPQMISTFLLRPPKPVRWKGGVKAASPKQEPKPMDFGSCSLGVIDHRELDYISDDDVPF